MIHFLVDSSAVWRMQRQPEITEGWDAPLLSGAIGSCEPQRAEFRRSARSIDEFDQMNRMFAELYPDVPVPKSVWRRIDAAQHRLAGAGAARALSVVDLLVCGTAADDHRRVEQHPLMSSAHSSGPRGRDRCRPLRRRGVG